MLIQPFTPRQTADGLMEPRYDALPLLPGSDLRHAWDVFGRGDTLGTLNRLTGERRREAAQLVRHGLVANLSLPVTEPSPALFERGEVEHTVFQTSSFSWDDRVDNLYLQGSTQWDGLLHVRHKKFGFYGGELDAGEPFTRLGIDNWVEHGIVGRGVLLDVQHYFHTRDEPYDPLAPQRVTAGDLARVADSQGVELRHGDVLCLRFGWIDRHRGADPAVRKQLAARLQSAGLDAGADTARFLWDGGVAALACDNPAVEVQPGDREDGYLHHRLLTMLGMPLGELFTFDDLAQRCRALGVWEFLFVSTPLHVPGAVGAPANAIAVM
jgi:kynurenine formamidase